MTKPVSFSSLWMKLPLALRAVVCGLFIALAAANVWPLLLMRLTVPEAAIAEAIFLTLYVWWASGGGPPLTTRVSRALSFRQRKLSPRQWFWAVIAAFFFAVSVHASIVLLFRFVPFPTAEFRRGYDFSFIPSLSLKWLAIVFSAISAGICEETGFRGYLQRPIEVRHNAAVAILISSLIFTLVHLTKGWALAGMVPIVFGAGALLGTLAWTTGSLIPGIVGHILMDIWLFAFWWTGIAGNFVLRPVSETGIDKWFIAACLVLACSLSIVLLAMARYPRQSSAT